LKTIIRKYDSNRVALLPTKGFPEDYAKWLLAFSKRRGWEDFKIVVTQDKWKQLGVVCRPKQWIAVIKFIRSKGEDIVLETEDEFLSMCVKVMKEEVQAIEKPVTLTKDEKEAVKIMTDKALEIDVPEVEGEDWKKEETK
jgi:hypothetical protein